MSTTSYQIFKSSTRTYFYSSLFFPKSIRDQVADVYAFVRVADDFVDTIPQDVQGLKNFQKEFNQNWQGKISSQAIISNFVELAKQKKFQKKWIDSFFDSMFMDTKPTVYSKPEDTLEYMHGSAEVIGLMMAKVMDLSRASYPYAQLLGRSMQYINFIRDIDEDNRLGRMYFARETLDEFKLKNLEFSYIKKHQANYHKFIQAQLHTYHDWQQQAEVGFSYIPRRLRIPIKTASEMYKWTAEVIKQDPLIVYCHKVKPSKGYVIKEALINTFTI